jgi:hypothetical protein
VGNHNERPIRERRMAIPTRRSGDGVVPMFECTFVRLCYPSEDTNYLFRVIPKRNQEPKERSYGYVRT